LVEAPEKPRGAGVRSKLPAGIVDAGFASLATFVAGLIAVTLLNDVDRGIYAVFFVAFNLGAILAYQLVYVPAEIVAVGRPEKQRLTIIDDSLRIGRLPALGGSMVILAATASTSPIAEVGLAIPLTVSALIATYLSPTQDHLRRTLHIANRPWHAAYMSIVQFVVTTAAIGLMWVFDVPVAWIPFGSLAIANTLSMAFGRYLIYRDRHGAEAPSSVTFRELSLQGRWLLFQAIIPALAAFATANIITYLASPEAMGYAEAARIVAQPIMVAASGLTSALRPRVMEAAILRDFPISKRVQKLYLGLIVAAAAVYIPIVGFNVSWNPILRIVPAAYEVEYLVIAAVASNVVMGSQFLVVNEMMAAHRARALTIVEALATPLRLLAAVSAVAIGAFALPFSQIVNGFNVLVFLLYMYRDLYGLGKERSGAVAKEPSRLLR
jgi:O-antigen/teichoic acid export membrane protein